MSQQLKTGKDITNQCHQCVASPSRSSGPFQVPAELVVFPLKLAHEGLGTIATLVWSLPRMCPHMIHEMHLLREGLGAQVALKRSLTGVDAEVGGQLGTHCEGLAAVAANIQLADVGIFGAAQVAATSFSEREMWSCLSGR